MKIVEPFGHDDDFFTEFGNDDVNAHFKWKKGALQLEKLVKGWGTPNGGAGLVQTEAFTFSEGVKATLDFIPKTNTVGNAVATDDCSVTLLNFQAQQSGLPLEPALALNTYGFTISGGKAAIQNGVAGAQLFGDLVADTEYTVTHEILEESGHLQVSLDGGDFSGVLGVIEADFRGYFARANFQPYFTDTLWFKKFTVKIPNES